MRAVTYVNAEQAPKTGLAGADPPPLKGKATVAADRGMTHDPRRRSCRGKGDGTVQEGTNATRETLFGESHSEKVQSTDRPRGKGPAEQGVGEAHSTVEAE